MSKAKFRKSEKTILQALSVLDDCKMNIQKASVLAKISRPTMKKYKEEYWNKYIEVKSLVVREDLGVAKFELENAVVLSATEKKLSGLFEMVTDRLSVILSDKRMIQKITFNQLINAINVLAPYLIAKKSGSDSDNQNSQADTVLNKIKKAMTEKAKQININNAYIQQNNYKEDDISEDQL